MFKKLAILVLFVVVSSTTLFSQTYPSIIPLSALADKDYELKESGENYIIVEIDGVMYYIEIQK